MIPLTTSHGQGDYICHQRDLLHGTTAVVCHDAGATNLIIAWLLELDNAVIRPCVQGPAVALWRAAFPNSTIYSLDEALSGSQSLLSGTGWASALEHDARVLARDAGIHTIAVIDHWVHYLERFERHGVICLPDEVWVADHYAFDMANDTRQFKTIRRLSNSYLETQVKQVRKYSSGGFIKERSVLYALEPVRQAWRSNTNVPGEFQALDFFCANLVPLGIEKSVAIRLRPHPSDPIGKYNEWIARNARVFNVELAADEPLGQAIARAEWVVGCESYVLVIALAAGKKVASTLPPWGHECRLPHSDIHHLKRLL